MDAYSEHWLTQVAATVKPRTVTVYRRVTRLHLLPAVGNVPVRSLTRPQIKGLLVALLTSGKARGSVQMVLSVLHAMLGAAIEDGLIAANPCSKLGRVLRLGVSVEPEHVKAFDVNQLAAFLEAVRTADRAYDRRFYPFFFALARTGLRVSEAIELKWEDLDFGGRRVLVRRAISQGLLGTPKSSRERTVRMSAQLSEILTRHRLALKEETLKRGWQALPEWVFVSTDGTPLDESRARKVLHRALKVAGLPDYFNIHSLRHSFASILLARGESPQFVQEQLGHQSLDLTTRIYGRWLPKQPLQGGVDGLDGTALPAVNEASGSKTVAGRGGKGGGGGQVAVATALPILVPETSSFGPRIPCHSGITAGNSTTSRTVLLASALLPLQDMLKRLGQRLLDLIDTVPLDWLGPFKPPVPIPVRRRRSPYSR